MSRLIRWSGLGCILGAILWTLLELCSSASWSQDLFALSYEDYNRFKPLPLLLLLSGLVGFYGRHRGRSGILSKAGFAIAFVGLALILTGNIVEFWVGGGIRSGNKAISNHGWHLVLAGMPVLGLGLVVFGIATTRARLLPGWKKAMPLLIVALPALGMLLTLCIRAFFNADQARREVEEWGFAATILLFGLGWGLLGYALASDKDE